MLGSKVLRVVVIQEISEARLPCLVLLLVFKIDNDVQLVPLDLLALGIAVSESHEVRLLVFRHRLKVASAFSAHELEILRQK